MAIDMNKVKEIALRELNEGYFREAVEKEKDRLKQKKSILDIIFPYRIVLVKKGSVK